MPAGLAGREARVAALEAERADSRFVCAARNALGENQGEHGAELRQLANYHGDTNARVRSLEKNLAGVTDLLVRALERR